MVKNLVMWVALCVRLLVQQIAALHYEVIYGDTDRDVDFGARSIESESSGLRSYQQPNEEQIENSNYYFLCKRPGSHVMILHPDPDPGENCDDYVKAQLTDDEKDLILDFHNELRSKVAVGQGWRADSKYDTQPLAANMRQMYWDNELEMIAQRWADQCMLEEFDDCEDVCRDSNRFLVGQNCYGYFSHKPLDHSAKESILEWYSQIINHAPNRIDNFTMDMDIRHYTQLVWGRSFLLGCARSMFRGWYNNTLGFFHMYVCNYAPSGNLPSNPVYIEGHYCTKCPKRTVCSSQYWGLCSQESDELTTPPSDTDIIFF